MDKVMDAIIKGTTEETDKNIKKTVDENIIIGVKKRNLLGRMHIKWSKK